MYHNYTYIKKPFDSTPFGLSTQSRSATNTNILRTSVNQTSRQLTYQPNTAQLDKFDNFQIGSEWDSLFIADWFTPNWYWIVILLSPEGIINQEFEH